MTPGARKPPEGAGGNQAANGSARGMTGKAIAGDECNRQYNIWCIQKKRGSTAEFVGKDMEKTAA